MKVFKAAPSQPGCAPPPRPSSSLGRWLLLLAGLLALAPISALQAKVCTDNIRLSTQAEVDAFDCTEITLTLRISGPSITNLDGLNGLTSIGNGLFIEDTSALTNVDGLATLTTIGNATFIGNNSALTNIDGLAAVTTINTLTLKNNSALTNIDGLAAITTFNTLTLENNSALTDIGGLAATTTINNLFIEDNRALTNVDGLAALTTISRAFSITNNNALTNLDGLAALTTVDLALTIRENNALTNIDGLTAFTMVGHLYIVNNNALTSIDGFAALTTIDRLTILNNDALSVCCSLFPLIEDIPTVTVSSNAPGCNTQAQIEQTCTVDIIPPVITLTGPNPQIIECPASYVELNATATDEKDGNITGNIVIDASAVNTDVPGSYPVTYNVMDAAGNAATQVTRTVVVFDDIAPVIALTGPDPQVIECLTAYTELGATATDICDLDATVTAAIVIDASAVNTAVPGSYPVTYNVTDISGNVAETVTRTVNVVDTTPPVIALTGATPQIIECPAVYTELGATATDLCDLDATVTAAIVIDASAVNTAIPGSYPVTYNVMDAAGNAATQVTRTVNVVDTTPPVITLVGANTQVIECPVAYTELGATAADVCDLNLGPVVIDASAVNTAVPGDYVVKYDISDASGNAATQVTRTVQVRDTTKPIVSITSPADGDRFFPGTSVDVVYTVNDVCDLTLVPGGPGVVVTPADPTVLPTTSLPQNIVISVQATDASGNVETVSVTVLVQDPQDFSGDLIDAVNQLVTDGVLNGGQGNALVTTLEHIINKLDSGQLNSALGQLGAFINQVTDLIADGVLTVQQGQPLIDTAQAIVDFLTDSAGIAKIVSVPEGFDLGAATPNPFNPSTQISYQLPEAAPVTLVVYNMNGQQMRVLVQTHQSAGYYNVTWDGRDEAGQTVSSGVYLYRLTNGSFSLTNRMLLLK